MSATWNLIRRALIEKRDPTEALLDYVEQRYGEHEKDEVASLVQQFRKDPDGLRKAIRVKLVDKKADEFAAAIAAKIPGQAPAGGRGAAPAAAPKPSRLDMIQGLATGDRLSPDDIRAKQAQTTAVANSRPDRAGITTNLPASSRTALQPGEKPQHAMGSAGQHRPQVQPSQQIVPSTTGADLEKLRNNLKQLQVKIQSATRVGRQADPADVSALQKTQQEIDRLSKAGKSGVGDAQKRVDYITQTYGPAQGDQLAKKLGVPTTKQRTTKDDDGKEHIHIWSADRIARNTDPDTHGTGRDRNVASSPVGKVGGAMSAADLPDKGGSAKGSLRKPMRRVKDPQTGEERVEVRPGDFVGQRWKPNGVSRKLPTSRPDQATGNFKHGSRFTNPEKEGQEVVWDGSDWVLPSVRAAQAGSKAST